jgi:hypothetical protein
MYIEPVTDIVENMQETSSKSRKVSSSTPINKSVKNIDLQYSNELVEAQNRTTHAVRALAITFVAAPILFILVGGVFVLAASSGDTGLTVAAIVLGLFTSGWILISSISELAKSKVS